MKAIEMSQEEISAFADGELASQRVELITRALRHPAQQDSWNLYHHIGDVLRSDDMAILLSADFSARMAARIDAEPIFIAKAPPNAEAPALAANKLAARVSSGRRLLVPGLAAAAAAVYFVAPQLLAPFGSEKSIARVTSRQASDVQRIVGSAPAAVGSESNSVAAGDVAPAVVLRDPRIDEYLLAHQRFSPSMYGSAQFARSATFASDANK